MKKPTITTGADGIPTLEPEGPITCALPSYVRRIQTQLADLNQMEEKREKNAFLLDRESEGLNSRLLATDLDDTDAAHKLVFAFERVALIERRAVLLDKEKEEATQYLANLNGQAKGRMESAAAKHDQLRDENEITEKLSRPGNKSHREELEYLSKTWPKYTRDKAHGIDWSDRRHPERTAKRILDLAEEIFTDLPALAKD